MSMNEQVSSFEVTLLLGAKEGQTKSNYKGTKSDHGSLGVSSFNFFSLLLDFNFLSWSHLNSGTNDLDLNWLETDLHVGSVTEWHLGGETTGA